MEMAELCNPFRRNEEGTEKNQWFKTNFKIIRFTVSYYCLNLFLEYTFFF